MKSLPALLLIVAANSPVWAQSPGFSLHDAIDRALHSPQAAVYDAEVEQAQGVMHQAGKGPNPKLYISSEDLAPWESNFSFVNQTETMLYAGQTVEIAGKRSKRVALAQARLQEIEAGRAMKLRQLSNQVALAYWSAVSKRLIADLLRQDMQAVDEMVQYHSERVDAGAMKGVDLLRMKIERDRLVIALQTAELDAEQARLGLFKQIGVPASTATLTDSLDQVSTVEPVEEQVVLAQRQDIRAARYALQAAEADLRLQRANAIPNPDFLGGYKLNSGDNTAYAGLQFSLPVRDRNQGEIERARAAQAGAQSQLVALEQQARTEVRQAVASYTEQRAIVEKVLPEMRQHAKQNLEIIREAYKMGGVDLLRFIDAERTEFDVEVSAIRAMAQFQMSVTQLQLAYGVQP